MNIFREEIYWSELFLKVAFPFILAFFGLIVYIVLEWIKIFNTKVRADEIPEENFYL
jgi:hypothetical protein